MLVSSIHENNFNLRKASEIVGLPVKYKRNAEWTCTPHRMDVDIDSWIKFFAIFVSIGEIDVNRQQVWFILPDVVIRKTLYTLLGKLKSKYTYNSDNTVLFVENKHIYHLLSEYKKCQIFPEWVWKLNSLQANSLFATFRQYSNFDCLIKELADDLMKLCLHCGVSANITVIDGDFYRLDVSLHEAVVNFSDAIETVYDYSGEIFCLQVPSEVFYVRRNGIPCWTGNSRARGQMQILVRQPVEGRSSDGGLKIGEMERDTMIAHGGSATIQEKLFKNSDYYQAPICNKCGLLALVNEKKASSFCKACHKSEISTVEIPYASKLLTMELMGMGIASRIEIKDNMIQN